MLRHPGGSCACTLLYSVPWNPLEEAKGVNQWREPSVPTEGYYKSTPLNLDCIQPSIGYHRSHRAVEHKWMYLTSGPSYPQAGKICPRVFDSSNQSSAGSRAATGRSSQGPLPMQHHAHVSRFPFLLKYAHCGLRHLSIRHFDHCISLSGLCVERGRNFVSEKRARCHLKGREVVVLAEAGECALPHSSTNINFVAIFLLLHLWSAVLLHQFLLYVSCLRFLNEVCRSWLRIHMLRLEWNETKKWMNVDVDVLVLEGWWHLNHATVITAPYTVLSQDCQL